MKKEVVIKVLRQGYNKDCTISIMTGVGTKKYYILEDTYRPTKVYGETRIPAGKYKLALRKAGGMHVEYAAKYPKIHKGMIWLTNVPGYEYVYMHVGNFKKDTLGCLLVGLSGSLSTSSISSSTIAYTEVYPIIANLIADANNDVYIEIIDEKK